MELPGRASVERGVDAIDFAQLYRAEKRRARQATTTTTTTARSGPSSNNSNSNSNSNSNINNDNGDASIAGTDPYTAAAIATTPTNVSAPVQHGVPLWKYPELLTSSHLCTSIPRLDRTRDCLSSTGIYYQSNFLAHHRDYQNALWEWLADWPVNHDNDRAMSSSAASANNNNSNNAAVVASALGKWTVLRYAHRRVALWDATLAPLPPPLQWLVDLLMVSLVGHDNNNASVPQQHQQRPNHILINHYTSTQGILPHTDGPAYYDRTATISLGRGSVLLNFLPSNRNENSNDNKNPMQVLLHGEGSLLVFEGDAYRHYQHGIAELDGGGDDVEHASDHCLNAAPGTAVWRDERISITVRIKT